MSDEDAILNLSDYSVADDANVVGTTTVFATQPSASSTSAATTTAAKPTAAVATTATDTVREARGDAWLSC